MITARPNAWGLLTRILVAIALAIGVAGVATSPASADEPPEGTYLDPPHVWVDPTILIDDDQIGFVVDAHFPLPETYWVVHASAPALTESVTHCSIDKTDFGASLECRGIGAGVPGDKPMFFDIKSEGGDNWKIEFTVTVCPLTGCDAYFELALDPTAVEVCPGADLASVGPIAYEFNVPWNASNVAFGPIPSAAGGTWEIHSELPADGAAFTLTGSLDNPGTYTLPVTVTDEFGNPHDAELPITVLTPGECGMLAATGADPAPTAAAALALLLLGALALVARRRAAR
jgi:MYXO-CTERM domain-containing protein